MVDSPSPEATLDYLDQTIGYWRKVRDNPDFRDHECVDPKSHLAPVYIDAFQSARLSLFGRYLA